MITADNIAAHEMIGLETEIVDSTNSHIIGLKGVITDETKSMFTLKTQNGFKKIPKTNSQWKFSLDKQCVLDGTRITKKPHERLRKV